MYPLQNTRAVYCIAILMTPYDTSWPLMPPWGKRRGRETTQGHLVPMSLRKSLCLPRHRKLKATLSTEQILWNQDQVSAKVNRRGASKDETYWREINAAMALTNLAQGKDKLQGTTSCIIQKSSHISEVKTVKVPLIQQYQWLWLVCTPRTDTLGWSLLQACFALEL